MADLAAVLQELDMAQYLPSFIHNGFDSWSDVLDITEHDLYGSDHIPISVCTMLI